VRWVAPLRGRRGQIKRVFRGFISNRVSIGIWTGVECLWIRSIRMKSAKWSDRAESVFIKAHFVCFQNRTRWTFNVSKLGVVLDQGLRFGTYGIAPIRDRLQYVQKNHAARVILLKLLVQVSLRGRSCSCRQRPPMLAG
jgi:hypothetical protein